MSTNQDPSKTRNRALWAPDVPFAPAKFPFFYGWIIVAVGTLAMVFSIPGQTMGFSVFTDILIVELGLTRLQLSTAYCIGTVLSGLSLPRLGRTFDRIGARRMLVYASLATGLVLFYLSASKQIIGGLSSLLFFVPEVAIAFTVITVGFLLIRGSAQGVLFMTSRNAIGKWFDYHRGTALAASSMVSAFAFSIAPRVLDTFIGWFGWDGAWLVMGIATILVLSTLGWLLYRDNPEECGLVMDGESDPNRKRKAHADSMTHRDFTRDEALSSWPFWVSTLTFAFFALFATAYTFHVVSIGSEMGRDRSEMLGYFVPMAFCSVTTTLICGILSSKTRFKYLLVFMNLGAFLSVIGLLYLDTDWGVLSFIVGNGIGSGCFVSLSGIVYPRFYGRRWLGAISGIGVSATVIGTGLGPIAFGLSQDFTGSYQAILWICVAFPLALGIGSWWADNPQRRFAPIDQ